MPKPRFARHSVTQPLDTSYRLIPLTMRQNSIVDAEDFDWLSSFTWRAQWDSTTRSFYAMTGRTPNAKSMHRMILQCGDEEQGDHRNHDTLDNRRLNLRIATKSQNSQNRRVRIDNKTGCPGVHWHLGKWQARITIKGKRVSLGHFSEKQNAIAAYRAAAPAVYGEFTCLPILHLTPTI